MHGQANGRYGTCLSSNVYFRHMIGQIINVRIWGSNSSLPHSKSNMRHEETDSVLSMLFQVLKNIQH